MLINKCIFSFIRMPETIIPNPIKPDDPIKIFLSEDDCMDYVKMIQESVSQIAEFTKKSSIYVRIAKR
jgi:hypothetical protein